MANYRSVTAAAAVAAALVFAGSANANVAAPKNAALVKGSEKTINFFSGGAKVSKKRQGEVAALAATPSGGAAASVAQKTNFLQLGLVAVGAAAAGGAVASGSQGTAASN